MDIGKPCVVYGDVWEDFAINKLTEAPEDYDTVHHRRSPINMDNFHYHTDGYGAKFFDGKFRNTGTRNKSKIVEYERTEGGRLGFSQQAVYDENRIKLRYIVHVRFNEE